MRVTLLGCGSSGGVPLIGCSCAVCTSDNSKNKRTRVSVLVEEGGKSLLLDTSPDLRIQALQNNISTIDAILYTHDHADHAHGIDDVRSFNYHKDAGIPAYADLATLGALKAKFGYAFRPRPERVWSRPCLIPAEINMEDCKAFHAAGVKVQPFPQVHGHSRTLGFRINNFAYTTDANALPEEAWHYLSGLDLWVVDCLRYAPAPTHSHLANTLEWIARAKPKRAVLTHMGHELEYDALVAELPTGVEPGYDGLVIEL